MNIKEKFGQKVKTLREEKTMSIEHLANISNVDRNYISDIEKGKRNVEVLKQAQYSPFTVEKQVAIIYLGTQGLLKEVAVNKVKEFEAHFLLEMTNKLPNVLAEFKKGNLPEDGLKQMVDLANSIIPQYK